MAIRSFRRTRVQAFFLEGRVPRNAGWFGVARIALRKLDMLDYAGTLADLAEFHSIRINAQWRIIFRWDESGPTDVDIADYH